MKRRVYPRTFVVAGVLAVVIPFSVSALADNGKPATKPPESQDVLSDLKRLIEQQAELIKQLTGRIERLEKEKGIVPAVKPGEEPPIPGIEPGPEKGPAVPAP